MFSTDPGDNFFLPATDVFVMYFPTGAVAPARAAGQHARAHVAQRLNHEWARDPSCRVHALPEYYQATQSLYEAELLKKGLTRDEIGTHAGLADTSLSLAVDPSLVRADALNQAAQAGKRGGVYGDPRRASAELGRIGVKQIVDSSVTALHALMQEQAGSKPSPHPLK